MLLQINAMTENKRNVKPFRELPGGVRQQAAFGELTLERATESD